MPVTNPAIPIEDSVPIEDEDDDFIMAEVRRNRTAVMAEHGHDLDRLFEAMKRRQFLYGNDVVDRCKETGELVVIFKGSGKMKLHVDDDALIQPA